MNLLFKMEQMWRPSGKRHEKRGCKRSTHGRPLRFVCGMRVRGHAVFALFTGQPIGANVLLKAQQVAIGVLAQKLPHADCNIA